MKPLNLLLTVIQALLIETACASLYWEQIVDNVSYKHSSKPAARRDTAVAHDRDRNRIIIFGGRQTVNHIQSILYPFIFDDTWEFNLDTSNIK